jgi:molybdopterin synthase catalytic subunit
LSGRAGSLVRLQAEAVRAEALLGAIADPGAGALALFLGTVREENRGRRVLHLEYSAYPEMAEAQLHRLAGLARVRFGASGVAVIHRLGRLEIGEVSVGVAVAAPHRAAAFDACRYVIEELKRTVPIWKKEVFEGGEVWIEGAGESAAGGGDQP